MITGLDHIHLISGQVEGMVSYFEKVFDGKVVSRGEFRGFPMVRMDVYGAPISILGTEPEAGQLQPGKGSKGLDHFGFKVKNLEETVQTLKARGAKFSVEPTTTPSGIKIAFIEGPEGIRIELVERD
jgi:catechol 2,3-dioxygenase-like lactoylglutathione lyase family enzyme